MCHRSVQLCSDQHELSLSMFLMAVLVCGRGVVSLFNQRFNVLYFIQMWQNNLIWVILRTCMLCRISMESDLMTAWVVTTQVEFPFYKTWAFRKSGQIQFLLTSYYNMNAYQQQLIIHPNHEISFHNYNFVLLTRDCNLMSNISKPRFSCIYSDNCFDNIMHSFTLHCK